LRRLCRSVHEGSYNEPSKREDGQQGNNEPADSLQTRSLLAWREGLLAFSGESLETVVNEISRYSTVNIEISDSAVRAIRIGGQVPVGQTDAMLAALEDNFGLRVQRLSPDHVVLSAAAEI